MKEHREVLLAPVVSEKSYGLLDENKYTFIVSGTITVSIGPPIDPTGLEPGELNAKVESWIETEMTRIGDPKKHAALAISGEKNG